jgi:signal transduction histidine kinase
MGHLRKIRSALFGRKATQPVLPATLVFLFMLALIGYNWAVAVENYNQELARQTDTRAQSAIGAIKSRFDVYDTYLRAGVGYFETSQSVSREDWRTLVESSSLLERYGGVLGVGYVVELQPEEVIRFEGLVRAQGYSDFSINPKEPKRDTYTAILYIEPFDNKNRRAFGYDMFSEEIRREAMEKARSSGDTKISGLVELKQNIESSVPSFLMYHYASNVRGSPETGSSGYTYSPIRADEFIQSVVRQDDPMFAFEVHDVSEPGSGLLYSSRITPDHTFVETIETDMLGRQWHFDFYASPEIVASSIRNRPNSILIGGFLLASSLSISVYLLLQRRARDIVEKHKRIIEKTKDNLLSLASHQLRTPATGVKQYVGMVLQEFTGAISDDQRDLLQRAYDNNERQLRIINDFLYMAKADAGRIVLSYQKFDFVNLVQDVIEATQADITGKEHRVLFKPPKQLTVEADEHSTKMIVENLLSNAIKYTPHNGTIRIRLRSSAGYAVLTVEDNGVGVREKDVPKLFKQFSRIPNPLTQKTTGSGIGLYLSKKLAKLHGGALSFSHAAKSGSVFTLRMPKKKVTNFTENTGRTDR